MKELLLCLFTVTFLNLKAQTKINKYYDANWTETSVAKATFYADFVKDGSTYVCTSYWVNPHIIRGKSTYPDTVMAYPIGSQVLYFKNGHIEDSSFFEDKKLEYSYHFYPNSQLAMHYYLPDNKKEGIAEGYDESGKKIKDYIFEKDAEFKGGQKAWESYINKNATKDLTVKGDTPVTATVTIEFIINEDGDVTKSKVYKSSGYKNADDDALRVISESPSWKNAIQYNKQVKAYRRQPFIYMMRPEKK